MKKEKYDIILDAARELMCSKGSVADITVDMIAKQAGIGKGSIYYYFSSKDEIIDAVIDQCYTVAIGDFIEEIKTRSNSLEKLKLLFQSILSSELRDKSRNVIRERSVKGELHAEFPEESSRMIVAMLTFLLDNYFFPDSAENRLRSLKLYSQILETCLKTKPGSFDFLTQLLD